MLKRILRILAKLVEADAIREQMDVEDQLYRMLELEIAEETQKLHAQIKQAEAEKAQAEQEKAEALQEKAMALGKLLDDTVTIVRPDTIRRWHRQLVKRKWDHSEKWRNRPQMLLPSNML